MEGERSARSRVAGSSISPGFDTASVASRPQARPVSARVERPEAGAWSTFVGSGRGIVVVGLTVAAIGMASCGPSEAGSLDTSSETPATADASSGSETTLEAVPVTTAPPETGSSITAITPVAKPESMPRFDMEREWLLVADSPLAARVFHVVIAVEDGVLIWGGLDSPNAPRNPLTDGAVYDPVADVWTPIAEAPVPVEPGWGYSAVVTDTGVVVVGQETEPADDGSGWLLSGGLTVLSYDFDTDAWEVLVPPPLPEESLVLTAVWTGEEVVVWGGPEQAIEGQASHGAAYDPRAGRWRVIAGSPMGPRQWHRSVWTGEEMIVWGGTDWGVDGGVDALEGAAYNPVTDEWRPIARSGIGLGAERFVMVWSGTEAIVWGLHGTSEVSGAYDPVADSWRPISTAQMTPRWEASFAWSGSEMLIWGGYTPAVLGEFADGAGYDPVTDEWTVLPASVMHGRCGTEGAWHADAFVVWGGHHRCGGGSAALGDGARLVTRQGEDQDAN